MKRIPQNIIEQVFNETDIVDIISEYIPLKKSGSNYKARCPFHQEKTASFMVSPDKQIFHCFGCGEGGNVVSFVMKHEHMEYPHAIEKLATRLNIKLEYKQDNAEESERDRFYKINAYANWYFMTALEKNTQARNYLLARGLSEDIIKKYNLGFAPDGYENLVTFLSQKNIPWDLSARLGLIKKRDSQGHYDFFRNRIIFPIHNSQGKIVGFGGRTLSSEQEAKYLNSSESPVYNKSRELYGFFQAKKAIVQTDQAIIVEGYIDVLATVQLDIPHVVAPLGTSLTEDQLHKLKKFTANILLMFDGDSAGLKAAKKSISLCFSAGIHPKLVILPTNKDPGDFLDMPNGQNELKTRIEKSIYAMEWLFANAIKKATHEPSSRAAVIKGLSVWIKRLPDSIEQMEYRKKLAQYFEISPSEIEKIVEITYKSDNVPRLEPREPSLEAQLIWLCLNQTKQITPERLGQLADDFMDSDLKGLAKFIEEYLKNHETFETAKAIQLMPNEMAKLLSEILLHYEDTEEGLEVEICIQKFQSMQNKKRLKEITAKILEAEVAQDNTLTLHLLKEKQKLLHSLKN